MHTSTLTAGEVLKQSREGQGLSIEDVSAQLKLSTRQIAALESSDFSALPDPMITRGFIRNYARLLGIKSEPLIDAYQEYLPANSPKPISIQSANILIPGQDKRYWLLYTVASSLIVLLVVAWVVYMDYMPRLPETSDIATAQTENLALHPEVSTEAHSDVQAIAEADVLPPAAEAEPAAAEPVTASGPIAEAITATPVEPTASPVQETGSLATLTLSASETSWVSVVDRNGKSIFDRILSAGVEETVKGQPPFQVVVGNAPNTTLVFNGQAVDLAPATKDKVARLKLE
ncbi:Cytoskeleton protein RodZ [Methylophilaceae bacterium]|nr:Cytoskeleton protein RodZ [Methylophilaceae bacterium]